MDLRRSSWRALVSAAAVLCFAAWSPRPAAARRTGAPHAASAVAGGGSPSSSRNNVSFNNDDEIIMLSRLVEKEVSWGFGQWKWKPRMMSIRQRGTTPFLVYHHCKHDVVGERNRCEIDKSQAEVFDICNENVEAKLLPSKGSGGFAIDAVGHKHLRYHFRVVAATSLQQAATARRWVGEINELYQSCGSERNGQAWPEFAKMELQKVKCHARNVKGFVSYAESLAALGKVLGTGEWEQDEILKTTADLRRALHAARYAVGPVTQKLTSLVSTTSKFAPKPFVEAACGDDGAWPGNGVVCMDVDKLENQETASARIAWAAEKATLETLLAQSKQALAEEMERRKQVEREVKLLEEQLTNSQRTKIAGGGSNVEFSLRSMFGEKLPWASTANRPKEDKKDKKPIVEESAPADAGPGKGPQKGKGKDGKGKKGPPPPPLPGASAAAGAAGAAGESAAADKGGKGKKGAASAPPLAKGKGKAGEGKGDGKGKGKANKNPLLDAAKASLEAQLKAVEGFGDVKYIYESGEPGAMRMVTFDRQSYVREIKEREGQEVKEVTKVQKLPVYDLPFIASRAFSWSISTKVISDAMRTRNITSFAELLEKMLGEEPERALVGNLYGEDGVRQGHVSGGSSIIDMVGKFASQISQEEVEMAVADPMLALRASAPEEFSTRYSDVSLTSLLVVAIAEKAKQKPAETLTCMQDRFHYYESIEEMKVMMAKAVAFYNDEARHLARIVDTTIMAEVSALFREIVRMTSKETLPAAVKNELQYFDRELRKHANVDHSESLAPTTVRGAMAPLLYVINVLNVPGKKFNFATRFADMDTRLSPHHIDLLLHFASKTRRESAKAGATMLNELVQACAAVEVDHEAPARPADAVEGMLVKALTLQAEVKRCTTRAASLADEWTRLGEESTELLEGLETLEAAIMRGFTPIAAKMLPYGGDTEGKIIKNLRKKAADLLVDPKDIDVYNYNFLYDDFAIRHGLLQFCARIQERISKVGTWVGAEAETTSPVAVEPDPEDFNMGPPESQEVNTVDDIPPTPAIPADGEVSAAVVA
eukprot:TRINITY_DN3676_c2_g1_i1.p1 TRINITY_DN3676_c2_g1~~TRINITY_DN3676_c2_g1_i1.p1  ORF type:complete len:1053 (-),score=242.42 TRINITY_DN3676_c2_g1_i1:109-3267(-)